MTALPVVVLGAGPVGGAVREWGHVRTVTPWQWIVDPVAERLLESTGWTRPATPVPPTGDALAEHYLEPRAAALGDAVRTGARVVAVTREESDFVVRLDDGEEVQARAVIDARHLERPEPPG